MRYPNLTPFLKWAGGKRWLVKNHSEFFPTKYKFYIEPFLGSGAVYFSVAPSRAILGDSNADLIVTYEAIKTNPKLVVRYLRKHHRNHSADYYYRIRHNRPSSQALRAARFIYLNRTCWNGLYRVNLKGEFNVPIGTKTEVIREDDDFEGIAQILNGAELVNSDFESLIDRAEKYDFVFVDPPYTVNHNNNGFLKYNEALFQWEDQLRLKDSLNKAVLRGAYIVLMNAKHQSILDLYNDDFDIVSVQRASVIAADSRFRCKINELIITSKR